MSQLFTISSLRPILKAFETGYDLSTRISSKNMIFGNAEI